MPFPTKAEWLATYTDYILQLDDALEERGYRRILTGEGSPLMQRKVAEDADEAEADVFLALAVAKLAGLEDPWGCLEGRVIRKPAKRAPYRDPLEEWLDGQTHPWDSL